MGKRNRKDKEPDYRMEFHEGDMVWLAEEYRRRSRSEPSLSLKDFAAQYGVSVNMISVHIPELYKNEGYSIFLWHGTTRSRAESILREGFKPKRNKRKINRIYFTRSRTLARSYAVRRSKNEHDHPAVIMCNIDLSYYNDYKISEQRGAAVFAFKSDCIEQKVVSKVEGLSRRPKQIPQQPKNEKDTKTKLTDIALMFNSARAGVAYWINNFLELDDGDKISENHEVVFKIKLWIDEQSDAGRIGLVPDHEILEQLHKHLPQNLRASAEIAGMY
jgi:hypothetical protein